MGKTRQKATPLPTLTRRRPKEHLPHVCMHVCATFAAPQRPAARWQNARLPVSSQTGVPSTSGALALQDVCPIDFEVEL